MAMKVVVVREDLVGKLLICLTVFLNSCVALSQDDLDFVDFTVATERPEFELTDMRNGSSYNTLEHEGAAYVIEFYFSSCPACNQNADNVKRLQNAYAGNAKVQIIELSIDCRDSDYQRWMGNHPPVGPVLNGCNANVVDELGVSRFPTTYVFAPNKREAMRGTGIWSNSTYDRMKRFLDQVK